MFVCSVIELLSGVYIFPSGFFNAILFVITSKEGRLNVLEVLSYVLIRVRYNWRALWPWASMYKKRNSNSSQPIDDIILSNKEQIVAVNSTYPPIESNSILEPTTETQVTVETFDANESRAESSFGGGGSDFNNLDLLTLPESESINALVRNSINVNNF